MRQNVVDKAAKVRQERNHQASPQIKKKSERPYITQMRDSHSLDNVSCRIGDSACAAKHVPVIQRTGLFHPMNESQKVQSLTRLQQQYGNQFVQKIMAKHSIQTKLKIGQPGDIYEKEADRMADQVMQMSDSQSKSGGTVTNQNQISPIQRLYPQCGEEKELQAKLLGNTIPQVTPHIQTQIDSLRGQGQQLPNSTRSYFGSLSGYDVGNVRLHTDPCAAQLAQSLNARAFTIGRDIVFGAGQYTPQSFEGKKLLAHELTHVLQQGNGRSVIRRKIQFDPPKEIRKNPIGRILSNKHIGLTTPTCNGKPLPDRLSEAGQKLFEALEPTGIGFASSTKECTYRDFDVKVSANVILPTQPKKKRWKMYFPGANIKDPSCHKKNKVPVAMTGKPDSNSFLKWIEGNEKEHVDDLKKLYAQYLQPYFKQLLSLKIASKDIKKCPTALHKAVGRKGALAINDFLTDWLKAIKDRHKGGRHSGKKTITPRNNCSRVKIELSK